MAEMVLRTVVLLPEGKETNSRAERDSVMGTRGVERLGPSWVGRPGPSTPPPAGTFPSPPPTAKGSVCISSQLPHSTGRDTKAQRCTEGAGSRTASKWRHHVGPRPSSSGQGSACPGSAARPPPGLPADSLPPPAAPLSAGTILAPRPKGTNRATGSRLQRPQNQDPLWPMHASLKLRRR